MSVWQACPAYLLDPSTSGWSISNNALGNRILDALPEPEVAQIRAQLEEVTLALRDVVYDPDRTIVKIYFPTTAVLSVLTIMQDGGAVEIGTFGREGLSGSQVTFGALRPPSKTICQVRGKAHVLPVDIFLALFDSAPTFRRIVQRYTEALFNFMGQSIACNRLHTVNERCARWLLLTHDRVARDAFDLTQEFLAIMLGVRRPGVSIAAATLQAAGFIRYSRGHVEIIDREGLESAACECYKINALGFDRSVCAA